MDRIFKHALDSLRDERTDLENQLREMRNSRDLEREANKELKKECKSLSESIYRHKEVISDRETTIQRLEAEVKQLKSWKEEMLYVESTWDCQAVGHLLGLTLGDNIRANIQSSIEALQAEVKRLKIDS